MMRFLSTAQPFDDVGQKFPPGDLALFRMELHAHHISSLDAATSVPLAST